MFDFLKRIKAADASRRWDKAIELNMRSSRCIIAAADENRVADLRRLLDCLKHLARDEAGRTPLMYAARRGNIECLKLLLPFSDAKDAEHNKQSALHWAASHGQLHAVEALLPNSDANALDLFGDSALSVAARNGHEEIVRALAPATHDCRNALMSAVCLGRTACVQILIDRARPQDCFFPWVSGGTPLRRSAEDGSEGCLAVLLPKYGAQQIDELRWAAEAAHAQGKLSSSHLIQRRIADVEREMLDQQTRGRLGRLDFARASARL